MEPQQQLLQQNSQLEKINTSNYLCRQSSTRWTPTTEQIKLLKELYYINGVRSPTADQIQAICARLRRYGKIEGKNVFYWFQNHKARERQKKRLISTANNNNNNNNNITNPAPQFHNNINTNNNGGVNCWKQDEITKYPYINSNNNPGTGISCSSSAAGVVPGGGQLMGSFGYGAVNMENKFRDCSISGGVFNATGNMNNSNFSYAAATTYYSNFHDKFSTFDEDHEQDHYVASPEIETLPLFPMHNDNLNHDHHFPSTGYYTGGYPWSNGGGNGASLELSLNSYGYGCYSHNY